jgi:hypothetical protein
MTATARLSAGWTSFADSGVGKINAEKQDHGPQKYLGLLLGVLLSGQFTLIPTSHIGVCACVVAGLIKNRKTLFVDWVMEH